MIPQSKFSMPRLSRLSFPMLLTALAVLSLSVSAHAASLVADGGFESAGGGNVYFAGDTIDGGSWTVSQGDVFIDSADPYVYDGNNSLNLTLANPYVGNSVSQTLATVVGDYYSLNFWANADSANTFLATENGITLTGTPTSIVNNGFPGLVTNSSLFVDYSGFFKATSTSTTLDLEAVGNPPLGSAAGSVMVDDVSLTLVPAPEPGSMVLALTGMVGLGLLAGRKHLFPSLSVR